MLDPDKMLAAMPARLWAEWRAMYAIDPWDEGRADLRMGIICSTLDACHRIMGQPRRPVDFMPFAERRQRPEQSQAEMKAMFARAKRGFARAGKRMAEKRDN